MRTDKHKRKIPENAALDIPARRFWDNVDHDKVELFMQEPQHVDSTSGISKYDSFLRALHDPAYSRLTFPAMLRKFNLSLHEVQTIYTDGMRQMGLLQMSNALPQVMADVSEDAKSQMVLCPRCDGDKIEVIVDERNAKGKVVKSHEQQCRVCEGVGKVKVPGDKHARDLMFESMKLTKQGGPLVAIQQNIGGNGTQLDSNIESLLKMTQTITVGGGRP